MRTLLALVGIFVLTMSAAEPLRVSGREQQAKLVNKVVPKYPQEAKEKGIEGRVKLQAVIGEDGAIKELKVLKGPEVFVQTSVDAVKQWKYEPTLLNGKPVEVITDIEVNYTLSQ